MPESEIFIPDILTPRRRVNTQRVGIVPQASRESALIDDDVPVPRLPKETLRVIVPPVRDSASGVFMVSSSLNSPTNASDDSGNFPIHSGKEFEEGEFDDEGDLRDWQAAE